MSQILYIAAKHLNLTLENVDIEDKSNPDWTPEKEIRSLIDENELDVVDLSNLQWSALMEPTTSNEIHSQNNSPEFELSVPLWEMVEVVTVVPKWTASKNAFNFVSVMPYSGWLMLLGFLSIYVFLDMLLERLTELRKRRENNQTQSKVFWQCLSHLFLYYTLALANNTRVRKRFQVFWLVGVAFFLVEFLKDELFSQLTTDPLVWPHSIAELYDKRNDYDFVSANIEFMKEVGTLEMSELAKITFSLVVDDPANRLEHLVTGRAVFLDVQLKWTLLLVF